MTKKENTSIYLFKEQQRAFDQAITLAFFLFSKKSLVHIVCHTKSELEDLIVHTKKYGLSFLFENTKDRALQNIEILDQVSCNMILSRKEELFFGLQSHFKDFRKPVFGKMSLQQITDRLMLSTIPISDIHIELQDAESADTYFASKMRLIKQSFKRFNSEYEYLDIQNPFLPNIQKSHSYTELQEILSKLIKGINEIIQSLKSSINESQSNIAQERNKLKERSQEYLLELKTLQLNSILDNIQENDIRVKKILSELNQFKDQFVSSDPLSDNIRKLKSWMEDSNLNSNHPDTPIDINDLLSDSQKLDFYLQVDNAQDDILKMEVFKAFRISKASGIKTNLNILNNLLKQINAHLYFLESNKPYFDWKYFLDNLSDQDKNLIQNLAANDQDWEQSFEDAFLRKLVELSSSHLHSIETFIPILERELELYQKAKIHKAFHSNLNLNEKLSQYRIHCLTKEEIGVHQVQDNIISINIDPEEAKSNNYDPADFIIYSEKKKAKLKQGSEILQNHNLYEDDAEVININNVSNDLTYNEINSLSILLGNYIHNLNVRYRIFQMKKVSLISFLSPIKNSVFLEKLNNEGLKEIFTDSSSQNLLPGVISNTSTSRFILIEDGILGIEADVMIKEQIKLFRTMKQMSLEIRYLFNYNGLSNTMKRIDDIVNEIKSINL